MHFSHSSMATKITAGIAAAAALTLGIFGVRASSARSNSPTANAPHHCVHGRHVPQLANAWVAAWQSSNPNDLAALFTKDAIYTDRGVDKVSHGRHGVATWQANTHKLIPDVSGKIRDAFRSGDRMLIETTYSGHIKGAPHPFAVPMATVLHLRGDRIATDTDYYNLADLLRQSGLPPTWVPPTN